MTRRFAVTALTLLGLAVTACGGGGGATANPGPLATAPPGNGAPVSPGAPSPGSSPAPVAAGGLITVLAPLGLNLRSAASTGADVVGRLGRGTTLTVIAHEAGWYHARGATKEGYVTDDPTLVSSRRFNDYSSQKGFSLLYPESWTFSETDAGVKLLPQSGPELLTIATAPTNDGIGAPGRPGYGVSNVDSIEVYGVTGTLRTFDRGAGAPPVTTAPLGSAAPSSAGPAGSPSAAAAGAGGRHLAEIRLAVGAGFFMRIDFDYDDPASLAVFRDIVDSIYLSAASVTPAPPSPGPSPTP